MTYYNIWRISFMETDFYSLCYCPDKYNQLFEHITNMHVKPIEKKTIKAFLKYLNTNSNGSYIRPDGIVFDFRIEGIGTEFDVLKNTKDFILNIELKSKKDNSAMLNQLKRNAFYLSKAGKNIYCYVFNMDQDKLYFFDGHTLVDGDPDILISLLANSSDCGSSIKELLSPEKYLASPFNDIDKFINKEYLLTESQKAKKDMIIKSSMPVFLYGISGTGKTLVAYDIASDYIHGNKKVLIIHGANTNAGQQQLNTYNFNIHRVKDYQALTENNPKDAFDLIILDEFQRFTEFEIKTIMDYFDSKFILSGDPRQILQDNNHEIGEKLNSTEKRHDFCKKNNYQLIELTEKIRTNASLSEFVKGLMNSHYSPDFTKINPSDITFSYFTDKNCACNYMRQLNASQDQDIKILTLPTTIYGVEEYDAFQENFDTGFQVIGQEFTNVATLIGSNIHYDNNGKMQSSLTYYNSAYALFQNITRTRKKLKLIIYNNEIILKRVLELLSAASGNH